MPEARPIEHVTGPPLARHAWGDGCRTVARVVIALPCSLDAKKSDININPIAIDQDRRNGNCCIRLHQCTRMEIPRCPLCFEHVCSGGIRRMPFSVVNGVSHCYWPDCCQIVQRLARVRITKVWKMGAKEQWKEGDGGGEGHMARAQMYLLHQRLVMKLLQPPMGLYS